MSDDIEATAQTQSDAANPCDTTGLSVYSNGTDYVIATDPADAALVFSEHYGESGGEAEFVPLPDDQEMTINFEDEPEKRQRRTMRQWVAQEGRGFLGTT
jgi:hypothetical protein